MPFTIQKNDDGEFCVFKKDDDDNATGDSLGCHKKKKEAVAQIGEIESKEKRRQKKSKGGDINLYIQSQIPTTASGEYELVTTSSTNIDDWMVIDAPQEEQEEDMTIKSIDDISGVLDELNDEAQSVDVSIDFLKSLITKEDPKKDVPDVDPRYAVKTLGQNRLGAYGILWGDEEHQDLVDEHFTPETADMKAIFDVVGKVPLIVHHGLDDEVKTFVYGEVDVLESDDTGLWWEAKIKEFEVYREYVKPLMDRKALFSSSGTLPAAKRVTKTGEITRWPVAEMTTTWLPAEWRMLDRPVSEIKAAYKALDMDCDLSEYDEEQKPETTGVEKTRLKALVNLRLSELNLLETEI